MTILVNSVVSGGGDNDQMIISKYTAAELAALAEASTLTPFATYVASDDPDRTRQTAKDTSTLIVSAFNSAAAPWSVQEYSNSFGTQVANLEGREEFLLRSDGDKAAVSSVFGNGELWTNVPLASSVAITASIAGTKMTVTAVGLATNQNGSSLNGAVNRGHYVEGDAGIPAGTHIIFDPTDTGDHGTGVYTLSADCGTIASKALTLSCAKGVGGVLERVTSSFIGSGSSIDPNSTKAWRLSIKPTHRVSGGHGRALVLSNLMYPGKTYRVEQMFRFHDATNAAWQTADYNKTLPSPMLIAALEPYGTSNYDTTNALGFGEQYVTNGPFGVTYNRGVMSAFMRTPDEEYAIKAGDGFWSWKDQDRGYQFDQEYPVHYVKGLEPIKLVYEVHLDGRMKSEGGRGWLKCWINNRLFLDYVGPTLYPAGRLTGILPPTQARLGMYDVTYPVVADNSLCSTIESTALERNMDIKYWRIKEIA